MRHFLFLLICFIGFHSILAQPQAYKFDDFTEIAGGGCDIQWRVFSFSRELLANPKNTGLILVYTGNAERFGNFLAYEKDVKIGFKSYFQIPSERISVIFLPGKTFFAQELWLIPEKANLPYKEATIYDWSTVIGNYHFSHSCLICEPNYSVFSAFNPNFEKFAEVLKSYPHYKGKIFVNDFNELLTVKKELTGKQNLARNRYQIHLKKKDNNEQENGFVDLFLINPNR